MKIDDINYIIVLNCRNIIGLNYKYLKPRVLLYFCLQMYVQHVVVIIMWVVNYFSQTYYLEHAYFIVVIHWLYSLADPGPRT